MALRVEDIFVGAVAFFDDELLLAETEIDSGGTAIDRPGPFVCVQVKDRSSVWIPVTGEFRPERLLIKPEWRQHGSDKWREDDQFVNDGLNTFLGPNEAFLRAGAKETPFNIYKRPRIKKQGIAAILEEIDKQGGPLL
jgi:hypothetical protein